MVAEPPKETSTSRASGSSQIREKHDVKGVFLRTNLRHILASSFLQPYLRARPRVRLFLSGAFFAFALVLLFMSLPSQSANAQGGNPPDQPRRGLVYKGLVRSNRPDCQNGFDVQVGKGRKPLCTHGPDAIPAMQGIAETVPPLPTDVGAARVVCSGDGQTGRRIQVMYVRAADRPDRYAEYVNSFQQWAAAADAIYNNSAKQTGGERHVRFVHDTNCLPIVENLVLNPEGDDSFVNTAIELMNRGYTDPDRNYLLYVDSEIYCGIANIVGDDSPLATNANNSGSRYARVDARCWSPWVVAHETMHTLGGVQMSAPHSNGGWHCYDESDVMCYKDSPTSPDMQYMCGSTNESLFDCNKDDYFNTNPARRSYLATHWNVANSAFLFIPTTPLHVSSLVTGKILAKKFTATDTFVRGDKVVYRFNVQTDAGQAVAGVQATVQVLRPDNSVSCTANLTSNTTGSVEGACTLGRNAPLGEWKIVVNNLTKAGYAFAPDANAVHVYTVGN